MTTAKQNTAAGHDAYTYAMHGAATGFSIESTAHGKRNVPLFYVKTRADAISAIAVLNTLASLANE